ncbi:hypothetical protein [Deinococcus ruber]|uniref:hypothetical protein n=1 Tax=Deinococcus ruber TaxID=1848197 RepID=UPI00166B5018|nr:hypothetical protein [Deinococcus ruber]
MTTDPQPTTPRPDGSVIVGLLLLIATGLTFLCGLVWPAAGAFMHGLIALLCLLVTLRALLSVWTLGLVAADRRLEALKGRTNLFALGAIALVCALALLSTI